jgi:hypothetical protein
MTTLADLDLPAILAFTIDLARAVSHERSIWAPTRRCGLTISRSYISPPSERCASCCLQAGKLIKDGSANRFANQTGVDEKKNSVDVRLTWRCSLP